MKQTQIVNVKVNVGKSKRRKRSKRTFKQPAIIPGGQMVAVPQFRPPEHPPPPQPFYLSGNPWMAPTPWSQTTKADVVDLGLTPFLGKEQKETEQNLQSRFEALKTEAEEPQKRGITPHLRERKFATETRMTTAIDDGHITVKRGSGNNIYD